jgi:hypothetical protein
MDALRVDLAGMRSDNAQAFVKMSGLFNSILMLLNTTTTAIPPTISSTSIAPVVLSTTADSLIAMVVPAMQAKLDMLGSEGHWKLGLQCVQLVASPALSAALLVWARRQGLKYRLLAHGCALFFSAPVYVLYGFWVIGRFVRGCCGSCRDVVCGCCPCLPTLQPAPEPQPAQFLGVNFFGSLGDLLGKK